MLAGLRVDVDTLRGTRVGVPRLLSLLAGRGIRASFFFSVGPDNMGRHLRRLLKPAFLWKMLRTGAPSLYGWSILRCGVIGRGPDIGVNCAEVIRRTAGSGHETGLHAWDHHRWQVMALEDEDAIAGEIEAGCRRLAEITGVPPTCSAAPAWRAPPPVLAVKERFPFAYNSDCRGSDCFLPANVSGARQPQVPVTLPTYDELVGRNGVTDANYNAHLLELFRPQSLNVLCIHAEVEGIAKAGLFESFLDQAKGRGISFAGLGAVLREQGELRKAETGMRSLPGREGLMCFQGEWRDNA
ncbi:MAG: polysaccharide deacetylase family protein [Planctomycetes bacterium]|nr:polysaccharide deacetylase family protein [Planctomycetota bacterium]